MASPLAESEVMSCTYSWIVGVVMYINRRCLHIYAISTSSSSSSTSTVIPAASRRASSSLAWARIPSSGCSWLACSCIQGVELGSSRLQSSTCILTETHSFRLPSASVQHSGLVGRSSSSGNLSCAPSCSPASMASPRQYHAHPSR